MKKKKPLLWVYYILVAIGIIIFLEGFFGVLSSFIQGLSMIVAGVVPISAKKRLMLGGNNRKKNVELGLIIFTTICFLVVAVLSLLGVISDPITKFILPLAMILIAYDSWRKTNKLLKK